jgi:hypothetical protein
MFRVGGFVCGKSKRGAARVFRRELQDFLGQQLIELLLKPRDLGLFLGDSIVDACNLRFAVSDAGLIVEPRGGVRLRRFGELRFVGFDCLRALDQPFAKVLEALRDKAKRRARAAELALSRWQVARISRFSAATISRARCMAICATSRADSRSCTATSRVTPGRKFE